MAGSRQSGDQRGGVMGSPLGGATQRQLAANAVALADAPRRRQAGPDLPDVAGKLWNLPNTVLGLGYGLAGHVAGELNRLRPGDQPDPRIQFGHNAVEFINNPAGGVSAITIGNTTAYNDDPYREHDEDYMAHERAHTIQGQQLGPGYLPSNILGGALGLIRDGEWHGPSNWNERGPQENPPRPWPARRPK